MAAPCSAGYHRRGRGHPGAVPRCDPLSSVATRSGAIEEGLIVTQEQARQSAAWGLRKPCHKTCQVTELLTVLPKIAGFHAEAVTGIVMAEADRQLGRLDQATGGAAAVANRFSNRHEPVAAGRSSKSKQRGHRRARFY